MSLDAPVAGSGSALAGLWTDAAECFVPLDKGSLKRLDAALRWPKNEFVATDDDAPDTTAQQEAGASAGAGGAGAGATSSSSTAVANAGGSSTAAAAANTAEDMDCLPRLLGRRGRYFIDLWEERDFLLALRQPPPSTWWRRGGGAAAAATERARVLALREKFADLGEALEDWSALVPSYCDDQFIEAYEHVHDRKGAAAGAPADASLTQPPVPVTYHHPAAWGHFARTDAAAATAPGASARLHPASVAPPVAAQLLLQGAGAGTGEDEGKDEGAVAAAPAAGKAEAGALMLCAGGPTELACAAAPQLWRSASAPPGAGAGARAASSRLRRRRGGGVGEDGSRREAQASDGDGAGAGSAAGAAAAAAAAAPVSCTSVVLDDDDLCAEARSIVHKLRPLHAMNVARAQRLQHLTRLEAEVQPIWQQAAEAEGAIERLYKQHSAGHGVLPSRKHMLRPAAGDFRPALQVGDAVDAFDTTGVWCGGLVTEVQRDAGEVLRNVKVSYKGWGAEFDEWFSVQSDRLAKPNTRVPPQSWPRIGSPAKLASQRTTASDTAHAAAAAAAT
eukprot:g1869.t1